MGIPNQSSALSKIEMIGEYSNNSPQKKMATKRCLIKAERFTNPPKDLGLLLDFSNCCFKGTLFFIMVNYNDRKLNSTFQVNELR